MYLGPVEPYLEQRTPNMGETLSDPGVCWGLAFVEGAEQVGLTII